MSVSRSPDSPDNAWPLPDRPTTSARSSPKRRTALRDGARPARAGRFAPSGRSSAMSRTMCSNRRTGARSSAERRATSPVRSQRRSKVSGRGFGSSPGRRARKASGSQERQGPSASRSRPAQPARRTGPVRSRMGEAAQPCGRFEESQAVEGRQGNHGFGRRERWVGIQINTFFILAQIYFFQIASRHGAGAAPCRRCAGESREYASGRQTQSLM